MGTLERAVPGRTEIAAAPVRVVRRIPGRRRRRPVRALLALGVLVAGSIGLWQVDLVRQNAQILWLSLTGGFWTLRGTATDVVVPSAALGEERGATVYTPPGYDAPENAARRYPVVYLLHGAPDTGTGWVRYGRAPQVVDRLIVQKTIPPVIVVCPDGRGDGQYGDSEYIDAPQSGGKRIATFITRDLVAWTDAQYRTLATPRGRVIGGVSTGAYGAVNLSLQHPDVFGTALALSGYYAADPSGYARLIWGRNPDPARLRAESPRDYVSVAEPRWSDTFLYLGNGSGEKARYRREADDFARRLDAAGIAHVRHVAPGHHSWDLWRGMLGDALATIVDRLETP